jgi:hypothetical protein
MLNHYHPWIALRLLFQNWRRLYRAAAESNPQQAGD